MENGLYYTFDVIPVDYWYLVVDRHNEHKISMLDVTVTIDQEGKVEIERRVHEQVKGYVKENALKVFATINRQTNWGVPLVETELYERVQEEALAVNKLLDQYKDDKGVYRSVFVSTVYNYESGCMRTAKRMFTEQDILAAIQFGKDIRSEKSFLNENFGSPYIDYSDTTEETNEYVESLKKGKTIVAVELPIINIEDFTIAIDNLEIKKIKPTKIFYAT